MPDHVPPDHGGAWQQTEPETAGFGAKALAETVAFALAHETPWRRDILAQLTAGNFEPPPDNEVIGPTAPRGGPNGILLRHGRVVARWGDTSRVDMTFSVAKSYLSLLAGLAVADGLIADLDEPVGAERARRRLRGAAQRRRHLAPPAAANLRMGRHAVRASPTASTANRSLASETAGRPAGTKGQERKLQPPGAFWGVYNDIRVNRLSLALLRRFGPAPAGRVRRAHHAADRGVLDLALAGLSHLDGGGGRPARGVGFRRRALGRRRVHQRRGPGAHRPAGGAPRRLGRATGAALSLDRRHPRPLPAQPGLRADVVAQHGSRP